MIHPSHGTKLKRQISRTSLTTGARKSWFSTRDWNCLVFLVWTKTTRLRTSRHSSCFVYYEGCFIGCFLTIVTLQKGWWCIQPYLLKPFTTERDAPMHLSVPSNLHVQGSLQWLCLKWKCLNSIGSIYKYIIHGSYGKDMPQNKKSPGEI